MADPVISLAKLKEIWNSQIQDENNWAFNKFWKENDTDPSAKSLETKIRYLIMDVIAVD
ncbi:hypothetical protein SAY86_003457 [Trapa natans]|uniref:Uncharacterized protein n=1 Tax=Trapa natans TaxID=22666 RepID=A0AAN7MCT7_TRANT|nr:hypothetical protein SAY86_003457 [Trapa natans]